MTKARKKLKVLCLLDNPEQTPRGYDFSEELKTPEWQPEKDIFNALKRLGHDYRLLGLHNDLDLLFEELREFEPDVVFNLMEEYDGDSTKVANVMALLEMLKVPYTGAPPLGLRLAKDKALAKVIMEQHEVPTPPYQLLERGKSPKRRAGLEFPIVIKPRYDDASYSIAQASVVENDADFEDRVKFVHEKAKQDALAEQFITGRELYVSVLGTQRLRVYPIREVKFGKLADSDSHPIASYSVKWDAHYRRRWGVKYHFADLPEDLNEEIADACREAYRALHLRGYARLDLRLDAEGRFYILEANPNPHLARYEDFALSAEKAGVKWNPLIQSILNDAG
jgi:D-alanine-D-alanine ligase